MKIIVHGAIPVLLVILIGGSNPIHAQPEPEWLSMADGQRLASADKKVVFIFVEAEWCEFCKKMKKEVFPNQEILALLDGRFTTVSVDLDSKNPLSFNGKEYTERSFAQAMNVVGTPTMIFADDEGNILGETSGYYGANRFLLLLSYLDSDRFEKMSFEQFETEFANR